MQQRHLFPICIVRADQSAGKLIERHLAEEGYPVLRFRHLDDAMQELKAILKHPISIAQSISTRSGVADRNSRDNVVAWMVLCDSKYGCDAYSHFWGLVKGQLADHTVFVVLIASHIPIEAEQEKWFELGAYDFIMEPVSKSTLSRKIKAYEAISISQPSWRKYAQFLP